MTEPVLTLSQSLRWADTDALGHVWHGTHVALIEEVRTAWLNRATGVETGIWDHVIVRIELDLRGELRYDDGFVTTTCRGAGCGRTSVRSVEQVMAPSGEVIAQARSVVVAWDPALRNTRPLTAAEHAAFTASEPQV